MPLMYEKVYRARSLGQVLHGAVVELARSTHQSARGREIVGASFVLLQPTHGLLVASKFKLSARMLYSRLFSEFVGMSFAGLADHITTRAQTDAVITVKSVANDLNFVPRNGTLHLIVRPGKVKFTDLPYKFAIYASILVLVARHTRLAVGDLIIVPLVTQVGFDEMGELFNSVAPLTPWGSAELPLPTSAADGLAELASGNALRMLENRGLDAGQMFGWAPVIASLHNLPFSPHNEVLDNLLAAGDVLAWPLD